MNRLRSISARVTSHASHLRLGGLLAGLLVLACAACVEQPYRACDTGLVCQLGYECSPKGDFCALLNGCGNGRVDPSEVCDDGNRVSGDGCNQSCTSDESCGNGVRDQWESCDDGNRVSDDGCSRTCRLERCGNGANDQWENCDDGNNENGDGCSADCLSTETCGNGHLDLTQGESCDDGNEVSGDGCSPDCMDESCGNGVVDPGESCDDDGTENDDGCSADCKSDETCGNHVVDFSIGEQCDDGNGKDGHGCSVRCSRSTCGDGTRDAGEECDDGNSRGGDGCSAECLYEAACGNGALDPGEMCDPGAGADCNDDCSSDETCNNGFFDSEVEECDDRESSPYCDVDCTRVICGDGVKNDANGEACDDGNTVSGDGCSAECLRESCGNGRLEPGEVCDDGGNQNGDGCSAHCRWEECGNAVLDAGEQCDDGNNVSGDGCSAGCMRESCGNGRLDPGEVCDDGGNQDGDGCSADCRSLEECGNAVLDPGEQCDDGNTLPGDECSATCQLESCGNGHVDPGEQCDDGGNQDGDGCSADCRVEDPSLASLTLSGIASTIELEPERTDYAVELPLLQQWVSVTAVVSTVGHTLTIAGMSVPSGVPSEPILLGLGDNPVDIVVENAMGLQRTYRLNLRRATPLAQYAYAKASNTGAADVFGVSVALSGDTLAVGSGSEDSAARGVDGNQNDESAPQSGAVYVFRRTGTVWQQEAYLKASNTGADDGFGISVALSGDILAVGAPGEDSAAQGVDGNQDNESAPDSGAVYVFRRTGMDWQQEAYLKASNTGGSDQFGHSVALAGDTLAVGAWFEASRAQGVGGDQADNGAGQSGAVYVFRHNGTTWQQEAYVKASNTGALDVFGHSVALAGDTLAVGAHGEDSAAMGVNDQAGQADNSAPDSGAVYVFRRTGMDWQQEAYVKASNTGVSDAFGFRVTLAGDTLAVSARLEDSAATGVGGNQGDNAAGNSGAVYVFRRSGTAWQQEAYVKASNTGTDDEFGFSVAVSADTLAVGAFHEDSAATGMGGNQGDGPPDTGAVYVFRRTGTSWQQEVYVKASNTGGEDWFGSSVALTGDTLAVGARLEDSAATGVGGNQGDDAARESGAVYVFH